MTYLSKEAAGARGLRREIEARIHGDVQRIL
jgi:hypothetical protein